MHGLYNILIEVSISGTKSYALHLDQYLVKQIEPIYLKYSFHLGGAPFYVILQHNFYNPPCQTDILYILSYLDLF